MKRLEAWLLFPEERICVIFLNLPIGCKGALWKSRVYPEHVFCSALTSTNIRDNKIQVSRQTNIAIILCGGAVESSGVFAQDICLAQHVPVRISVNDVQPDYIGMCDFSLEHEPLFQ